MGADESGRDAGRPSERTSRGDCGVFLEIDISAWKEDEPDAKRYSDG